MLLVEHVLLMLQFRLYLGSRVQRHHSHLMEAGFLLGIVDEQLFLLQSGLLYLSTNLYKQQIQVVIHFRDIRVFC